jgi:hypothetical protein
MANIKASQCFVAVLVGGAAGRDEADLLAIEINGPRRLKRSLECLAFGRRRVPERARMRVAEAKELDERSERRSGLQAHGWRAATLVREHEIVEDLECKRLAGLAC